MEKQAIFTDMRKRMDGALASLDHNLGGLRTGRASVNFLEGVLVEAYGGKMPLNQVATVSVPEARLIIVQVWDKTMAKPVEKAIVNANLGVTPVAEGQLVRVPLPALSEERRAELGKIAHEYGEQAKISVRNIRRDGMDELKKLEKGKVLTEDQMRDSSEEVQEVTDQYIKKIDESVVAKQKEIKQV